MNSHHQPHQFIWGNSNEIVNRCIEQEVMRDDVYQRFRKVTRNDTVLDIGANVGAFTVKALERAPKAIYCIEPSNTLIEILKKNTADYGQTRIEYINRAFAAETNQKKAIEDGVHIYDHLGSTYPTIRFDDFIREYSIERIEFLKMDCDGGEYDIFTPENQHFITTRVDYIAGEWHLCGLPDALRKFKEFSQRYLTPHTRFTVFDKGGDEITDQLFTAGFLERYIEKMAPRAQIHIYIENKA